LFCSYHLQTLSVKNEKAGTTAAIQINVREEKDKKVSVVALEAFGVE
jgi:hypothetical protein